MKNTDKNDKTVIFFYPPMEDMAIRAAEYAGAEIGRIRWNRFPDKWPNLYIEGVENIEGRDVVFIASFHSHDVLFEQLAVIYELPRYFVKSLRVILPFYPVGTMERIDNEGDIATAKTMARMLSATPMTRFGPVIFTIFDIHALSGRFYFDDQILPDLRSAVPLIRERIKRDNLSNLVQSIAFPDEGAKKRFSERFHDYPIIVCDKIRKGDKRIVTIKEGDPKGKYVLIVDDLIRSGGTLIECRNALIKNGARAVSAFATHGEFPDRSWEKFTPDLFEKIWITDSCPQTYVNVKEREPFEVLSLARVVGDMIGHRI